MISLSHRRWLLLPLLPTLIHCGGGGPEDLAISPTTLDFGPVVVGETSTAQLTVTNTGRKDLQLLTINISGEAGQDFSHGITTPVLLISDTAVALTFSFAPEDLGQRTAFLSLGTDVGSSVVSFEGEGIEAPTPTQPPTPPPTPLPGDEDSDGYNPTRGDCDESDPNINPGATEQCDGIDNNCNSVLDDVADGDGDDYTTCGTPADCDDADPDVNPGAPELCDGKDNNCDGSSDEGLDTDSDGFTSCAGDCDDNNPLVNPDAADGCNGIDNDCDGTVDEDAGDEDGNGVSDCDDSCPIFVKAGADAGSATGALSAPYGDIATALQARGTCKTISVLAGTYNEQIVFPADELSIEAADGPLQTILTATTGPIVKIQDGQGTSTSLAGFTLKDTHSAELGGCLEIRDASPSIVGNHFENCSADGPGGAAFATGGAPVFTGNTFSLNRATQGGAMYLSDAVPTLKGNTFEYNEATEDDGGALLLTGVDGATLEENTFTANTSPSSGGAVLLTGSDAVLMRDNLFQGNISGTSGGALAIDGGSELDLRGNTYTENESGDWGGGMLVQGVKNSTFTAETFTSNQGETGGAMGIFQASNFVVEDAAMALNHAGLDGGAIWVQESTEVTLVGSTIANNDADRNAGGVGFTDGGNYFLRKCVISQNRSTGSAATGGGGVFWFTGARGTMEQNVLRGNEAYNGAGSYVTNSSPKVRNNIFAGNVATFQGGGLYVIYASPEITNNTIVGNAGPSGGGGAIWGVGSNGVSIDGNIIAYSTAGDGVQGWGPYASISYNNVFEHPDGEYHEQQGLAQPGDLTGESGNISNDPKFVNFSDDGNFENDDFHLASGSPCIDAGINDSTYNDANGSRNDIGAYGGPLGQW